MIRMRPRFVCLVCAALILAALFSASSKAVGGNDGQGAHEFTVNCDKGKTIGAALAEHDGPVRLTITGICDEHVGIDRNDVSLLAGTPGAGIHGPDPNINTLQVTGDRFVLDGLSVAGGRNAIVVSGGGRAMIRNCVAHGTGGGIAGGIGIVFFQGANGTVDSCEVSGNAADGLMLDAAIATIANSKFIGNGRAGIIVFHGSNARIGMTNSFAAAPNTISGNGSAGIHVTLNSLAVIVGNEISGNGTNPAGPFGRTGITVFHSRADLPGGNLIRDNLGQGLLITGASSVALGDPGFGFPTRNTIRGNSTAAPSQGIRVRQNSLLTLSDAVIEMNNGAGITLDVRSTLNAVSSTVTGNTVNGVQLSQGSLAVFQPVAPLSTVSGNAGKDLKCQDAESTYTGPLATAPTSDCASF